MINRRQFVGAASLFPLLGIVKGVKASDSILAPKKELLTPHDQILTPLVREIFTFREFEVDERTIASMDDPSYSIRFSGSLPEKYVEGDELWIPTYTIGMTVDWAGNDPTTELECFHLLWRGIQKKIEDDAMHCVLASAVDRNVLVYDGYARRGEFTRQLVANMKSILRRGDALTSESTVRFTMTHMLSPYEIDWPKEYIQRTKFVQTDKLLAKNDYDMYLREQLCATTARGDKEFYIGLDLRDKSKFLIVQPKSHPFTITRKLLPNGRNEVSISGKIGICVLSNKYTLLGSA